jgi:hypothetical protein
MSIGLRIELILQKLLVADSLPQSKMTKDAFRTSECDF